MRFSSSYRLTLCVTPKSSPKGGSKQELLHSALTFSVACNRTHFKFGIWVNHSKSQPTDDKPSLTLAWSRHVIHFKFLVP